ncbi:cobyric acid synthase [Actinocrinis puniceicyclus]|uniref:Cobyric acid synthase n=1 Tax=Actinocrinis puniceicyclus TaxID=977794 RepID=A0A8J8BE59_9ACTN|nr:cobyric acid synthase [Actinocrinis puniceicyclus]MBS2966952.1 cobyric acid synthase [Actinocrinis puniceicyclus]
MSPAARGALLIAGTTSDAGKSVLTAAICRWLARQGVRVAPFKAQNMSNNSAVCLDPRTGAGAELGRAQAMQAAAAGAVPEPAMNPILLKPGGERTSQVVVLGRPLAEASAQSYQSLKKRLLGTVLDAFDDLRSRYDVVVCEGAGSPTEINLREGDLANLGLARARSLPALVVGDIDRGGVFAAFHGTVALLDAADQALICGFLVNRFRGDPALLAPGLRMIEDHTGRPVLGVVPYLRDIWLDAEDSLTLQGRPLPAAAAPAPGREPLTVTVVHLPRVSNFTDVDALMLEPGVEVSFTTSARGIAEADLVVVPGTKATVSDLSWLRERGIADALMARAARGGVLLGICGGYQMFGKNIDDPVESRGGRVEGLGLLPVVTRFAADKTLARPRGFGLGQPVDSGYEIHHGVVSAHGGEPLFTDGAGVPLDGCVSGNVIGTLWHGTLESDGYRRAFLRWTAQRARRSFEPRSDTDFAAARLAQYDRLADAVAEHVDTDALWRLIEHGPTPGLRLLPPGA